MKSQIQGGIYSVKSGLLILVRVKDLTFSKSVIIIIIIVILTRAIMIGAACVGDDLLVG